jgi:hypothetical protein
VEAVGKWNARPDNAKALDNDDETTTYDISYDGTPMLGVTNGDLLALWTALGVDPSEVDTAVAHQEGVVADAQTAITNAQTDLANETVYELERR